MGKKTERQESYQSVNIKDASPDESRLRRLLEGIARGAGVEFGDLSGLASGRGLEATAEDRRLADEIARAGFDQEQRELAAMRETGKRGLESSLLARGIEGSSIEAVDNALLERELMRQTADSRSSRSRFTAEFLSQRPFQRAEMQIGANRALLERLMGAANPALQASLTERLAQTTTIGKGKGTSSGATFAELLSSMPDIKIGG